MNASPIIADPLVPNCAIVRVGPVVVDPTIPTRGPGPILPVPTPLPGGCQCAEDELFAVWKDSLHPERVVQIAQVWTPIPDGYHRHRACLRFVKVTDGAIMDTFGYTISADAQAAVLGALPGLGSFCCAIVFSGYRRRRRDPAGAGWHSRDNNFTIYNVLCET